MFAQQSERPCRVYCVTSRRRGSEYLAVVIEPSVKDLCRSCGCKRMTGQVHALAMRGVNRGGIPRAAPARHGSRIGSARATPPPPILPRSKMGKARKTTDPNTILCLTGLYTSTCGYCGEQPGARSATCSSHSYGAYPISNDLTCSVRRTEAIKVACMPTPIIGLHGYDRPRLEKVKTSANSWTGYT